MYNRGTGQQELGSYTEAVATYDRVIAINTNYADAWHNRGTTLNKLGRYTEATESFSRENVINPNIANTWYNRGNALYKLGLYSDAVESFDKAIAINPNDADAIKNREITLEELNPAQQIATAPVQSTPQPQTKTNTLLYALVGAIVLIAGVTLWTQRHHIQKNKSYN